MLVTLVLLTAAWSQVADEPGQSDQLAPAVDKSAASRQAELISYLQANPPPAPPEGEIGLSPAPTSAPLAHACNNGEGVLNPSSSGDTAPTTSQCCRCKKRLLGGGSDDCLCDDCAICCDPRVLYKHSTCDLYPHFAYHPKDHGYYYFRPYNHDHIWRHQPIVAGWGGDPRNPYSTKTFSNLFADVTYDLPPSYIPPTTPRLPLLEDLLMK